MSISKKKFLEYTDYSDHLFKIWIYSIAIEFAITVDRKFNRTLEINRVEKLIPNALI